MGRLIQAASFCPLCGGRRMAERAAQILDDVAPSYRSVSGIVPPEGREPEGRAGTKPVEEDS